VRSCWRAFTTYPPGAGVQTKFSATDPVAEADRAVETLLVEHLSAARPDDGLLGEDGAQRVCQPVVRALRTRPDVVGVVSAGPRLLPELLVAAGIAPDRVCSLA